MTLRTKNIGPILILALAVATLVVVVGMWGWDGPPPVSAQTDTTAPTVLKVSFTSSTDGTDGVYTADEVIGIEVVFSETVRVTGTSQLSLNVGGDTRTADFDLMESCPVSASGDAECTGFSSPGPFEDL